MCTESVKSNTAKRYLRGGRLFAIMLIEMDINVSERFTLNYYICIEFKNTYINNF